MVKYMYPLRLEASLHETIWGGRRLEYDHWKQIPPDKTLVGEAWETEISNLIANGPYSGQNLGTLVQDLDASLIGTRTIALYGHRFPLLAKFIDANAQLSVQVHPDDTYAAKHEGGKLGKTEFWYILAAEPDATIVYGFKEQTSHAAVEQAIQNVALESLLHQEKVQAGDVIFVPAGTVHAIGSGILLYELQEYSDVTYRMYDYGRLTTSGQPRELHIERSLAVSSYNVASHIKKTPVTLAGGTGYEDRCLVACRYFVTREIHFNRKGVLEGQTNNSCIILSSLGAQVAVHYGTDLAHSETLTRGQTMILPAALGTYLIEGDGTLLYSYVPEPDDKAWQAWRIQNEG